MAAKNGRCEMKTELFLCAVWGSILILILANSNAFHAIMREVFK